MAEQDWEYLVTNEILWWASEVGDDIRDWGSLTPERREQLEKHLNVLGDSRIGLSDGFGWELVSVTPLRTVRIPKSRRGPLHLDNDVLQEAMYTWKRPLTRPRF